MPATSASAPGKIILFGEHAVVYGRPAIAVPVHQVSARAVVMADPRQSSGSLRIQAQEIQLDSALSDLPPEHPLACAVRGVLAELRLTRPPACTVRVTSTIPIAAGLGSGAAVSVAIIRALAAFFGRPLDADQVCRLAYEVEKLHHGTPSGIDNTVIAYGLPVYFVRDRPIETFRVPTPFTIVIGDTGVPSPTLVAVGDLRRAWQMNPGEFEPLFDRIGALAQSGREAIEAGQPETLGSLMNENHLLLRKLGVSSPELDRLVAAARSAGALGAKLSGGGRGGNLIALARQEDASGVAAALRSAGATRTITTRVAEGGK